MATTGDGGAAKATARWREALARLLRERFGAEDGASLGRRYVPVLGSGYRGRYGPEVALRDVELTVALVGRDGEGGGGEPCAAAAPAGEGAPPRGPLAMDLLRPPGADARAFRFKLFHLGGPVHLSDSLPMLENMGLRVEDEHPRELPGREGGAPVWLHDFGLRQRPGSPPADLDAAGEAFKGCFARVWSGEAEDDGFNRLALSPGLDWREVAMLRAYAKYLRQVRFSLSQSYMEDTLSAHPALVLDLVRLFHARFDPVRVGRAGGGAVGGRRAPGRARPRRGSRPTRSRNGSSLPSRRSRASTRTGSSAPSSSSSTGPFAPTTTSARRTAASAGASPSSSTRRACTRCRSRSRASRSSSIRPGSRGCTFAAARSRGAGSAGRIAARTSAPRCWGSSRPRW